MRSDVDETSSTHQVEKSKSTRGQADVVPRWAAMIGTLAIGILYAVLPDKLTLIPKWSLLVVEVVLLLPLALSHVTGHWLPYRMVRILVFAILVVVTAALASAVALLVYSLQRETQARVLLGSAALLWCFNILVFALWYWEIDGGGPVKRHQSGHQAADFMFPQQVNGNDGSWAPHFFDYLFLAFTGATALSPADTYPLTRKAKGLMMVEALISMSIIVLLAARAVNIF